MVAVACEISCGEQEATAVRRIDLVDRIIGLVEQVRQQYRVRWRADSVVNLGKIGDMRLVWLVKVHAVPAGRKMDLRTKSAGTVEICRKAMRFWYWVVVVDAVERDSVGYRSGSVLASAVGNS